MLLLSRKSVMALFMAVGLIIPFGQVLYIAGMNFPSFRIAVIFGSIRPIFSIREGKFQLTNMDKCIFLWAISSVVTYVLLWKAQGAFINKMGFFINMMGTYAIFRWAIQDWEDMDLAVKVLVYISLMIMTCMLIERITSHNVLSFLGSPEAVTIRDGKIRSTASFAHPILAGMFGGTLVPLCIFIMWRGRKLRNIAILGILSATIITFTSASSTPLLSYFAGITALCMWPLRNWMRKIRWGIVLTLLGLHIVMKAPVWALIGRVDVVGSSSGYHRYKLLDEFINRFLEWGLIGTKDTSVWGFEMWDTVNAFVSVGINGGLITFILFVSIIVIGFKTIGRKLKEFSDSREAQLRIWALGSTLFSHIVGFFGIVYFDQMQIPWYLLLSMISLLSILTKESNLVDCST